MGGVGSGPQKSPATIIKEAKENDAKNLPAYFLRLSKLALEGDRDALFYLINRHMGMPKATLELPDADKLGTGMVTELFTLLVEQQRKLREGDYDAKGTRQERLSEGMGSTEED